MKQKRTYIIAAILTAIALSLFFYKTIVLDYPLTPNTMSKSWLVEAKITFSGDAEQPAKVNLQLPQTSAQFAIADEAFVSQGFGLNTQIDPQTNQRQATWTIRDAGGAHTLFYRGVIYRLGLNPETPPPAFIEPAAGLMDEPNELSIRTAEQMAIQSLVSDIRSRSADHQSFVAAIADLIDNNPRDDRIKVLRQVVGRKASPAALAEPVVRAAGIPVRLVNGVKLEKEKQRAEVVQWLEIQEPRETVWRAFNFQTNQFGLSRSHFPWWVGNTPLISVDGGHGALVQVAVKQNLEDALTTAIWRGQETVRALYEVSLLGLPIETQLAFRVILMIPVGAFILIIFRQLVGISTFGTFTPILIALAFREAELVWGFTFFAIIVLLGLVFRFYYQKLQLLLVPRLAAVLSTVVLIIAFLAILTNKVGLPQGLSLTLFPMVILTMSIERLSITWEEYGPQQAMKDCFGTLIVAVVSYFFMNQPTIEHWVFVFPELLLIVLSGCLLMGRYSGYRLSELIRFRSLMGRTAP